MSLITDVFNKCREENRKAFVAYITAGDPDIEKSLEVVDALCAAGIDLLELGVPFSDPLADGEANQLAATRALESGTTPQQVVEMAAKVRAKYPELPLVLFTYLNPIAYSGDYAGFCERATTAGIDAILPLDMPPEESSDYRQIIDDSGLKVVSLVAPTTPDERLPLLAKNANAFIYYVSREGVTGEGENFSSDFADRITAIRKCSDLPVVVGFGISNPEHAAAAAATGVDGIVVGSAIVRKVEAIAQGNGTFKDIEDFVRSLRDKI